MNKEFMNKARLVHTLDATGEIIDFPKFREYIVNVALADASALVSNGDVLDVDVIKDYINGLNTYDLVEYAIENSYVDTIEEIVEMFNRL